jgi:hypothetical protein
MGGLENLIRHAPFPVFLYMFGIPLLLAGIGFVAGLLSSPERKCPGRIQAYFRIEGN